MVQEMKHIIEELNSAKKVSDELIFRCSSRCISANNAEKGIRKLKELARDCQNKDDYIDFFRNVLKLNAQESANGIVLYLGKKQCSCPIASELNIDKSKLCDCTKEHEKVLWSIFFGKQIDVVILESFWRGGQDCIIELVL